jgi:hypothetical protein
MVWHRTEIPQLRIATDDDDDASAGASFGVVLGPRKSML